jgi:hypothetical protein
MKIVLGEKEMRPSYVDSWSLITFLQVYLSQNKLSVILGKAGYTSCSVIG